MTRHRTTRPRRLSPRSIPDNRRTAAPQEPEGFDFNGTLYVLRDNLGRADTMVTCADELIVQLWSDDGEIEDITRRRGHVSFLMESASLAILTAIHAGIELDLHRSEA